MSKLKKISVVLILVMIFISQMSNEVFAAQNWVTTLTNDYLLSNDGATIAQDNIGVQFTEAGFNFQFQNVGCIDPNTRITWSR